MDVLDKAAREKWLAERKKGIGGSEVAAVLGISPWQSPSEVWARKRGLIPEQEQTFKMRLGQLLEAPVAMLYAEREKVQLVKTVEMLWDQEHHIFGSPDRLVKGKPKGVEVKTSDPMNIHQWGEEGSGDVPLYYATQCAIYMSLTGFNSWDIAVLFGTSEFRVYRLQRDLELEETILKRCKEFWERYVVGGLEPSPDGTKAYASYIAKKYPSNILPLMEANDTQTTAISTLIDLRSKRGELENMERNFENILKAAIADTEGIQSEFGKVIWKKTKDKEVVNWEKVARELAIPPGLIEKHTATKEGYRRFNVYPAKGLVRGGGNG